MNADNNKREKLLQNRVWHEWFTETNSKHTDWLLVTLWGLHSSRRKNKLANFSPVSLKDHLGLFCHLPVQTGWIHLLISRDNQILIQGSDSEQSVVWLQIFTPSEDPVCFQFLLQSCLTLSSFLLVSVPLRGPILHNYIHTTLCRARQYMQYTQAFKCCSEFKTKIIIIFKFQTIGSNPSTKYYFLHMQLVPDKTKNVKFSIVFCSYPLISTLPWLKDWTVSGKKRPLSHSWQPLWASEADKAKSVRGVQWVAASVALFSEKQQQCD